MWEILKRAKGKKDNSAKHVVVSEKVCRRCKEKKIADEFAACSRGDGLQSWCKACNTKFKQKRRKDDPEYYEAEKERSRNYYYQHKGDNPHYEVSVTSKVCCRCKQRKDANEFHRQRTRKDGLYSHCKSCSSEMSKAKRAPNRIYPIFNDTDTLKTCRKCKTQKDVSLFSYHKGRVDSYCKACRSQISKDVYKRKKQQNTL